MNAVLAPTAVIHWAEHRLARKDVVELEDPNGEPFVALARVDCSLLTIDRACQLRGVYKRSQIEVLMSETVCAFVTSGAGYLYCPPFVGMDYDEGRLVRRPLMPETTMDVWLLTSGKSMPSLATRRLADILRSVLPSLGSAREPRRS